MLDFHRRHSSTAPSRKTSWPSETRERKVHRRAQTELSRTELNTFIIETRTEAAGHRADVVSYRVWRLPVLSAGYRRSGSTTGKEKLVLGGDDVRDSPLNKQEHAVKATNYSRGERDCFQGECVLPEWQTAPEPCSLWRGRRRQEEVGSDCGAERW